MNLILVLIIVHIFVSLTDLDWKKSHLIQLKNFRQQDFFTVDICSYIIIMIIFACWKMVLSASKPSQISEVKRSTVKQTLCKENYWRGEERLSLTPTDQRDRNVTMTSKEKSFLPNHIIPTDISICSMAPQKYTNQTWHEEWKVWNT